MFYSEIYYLLVYLLGEHHYFDLHTAYGSGSTSNMFSVRDQEKENLCLEKGISLVYIPYWYFFFSLCIVLIQIMFNIKPLFELVILILHIYVL
jgi:hypothetical protein